MVPDKRPNADIVLVIPPFKSPFGVGFPLGLLSLATSLKEVSLSSKIVDFALEIYRGDLSFHPNVFDDCAEQIAKMQPKIVGFTIQCASMPFIIAIATRLKKISAAKIVFGGPQALAFKENQLKEENFSEVVDKVIVGEGESEFIAYCTEILNNEADQRSSNSWKNAGFPDYSLMNPDQLKHYPKLAYIDSARGCSGGCSFCSETVFWGKKINARDPDMTISHMRFLKETYGIRAFEFTHDNFLQLGSGISAFLDKLADAKLNISWSCRTRIETLNATILAKMKQSGCYSILLGIETPSSRRMDIKHQRLSIERIDQKIALALDAGIRLTLSFICGLPGETLPEMEETVRFAVERAQALNIKSHVHKFCPLPYSSSKDLDLVYDASHISDMAYTEVSCPVVQSEVDTLIETYPELCLGFYTERVGPVRLVDSYLNKINEILYHFPISFNIFLDGCGVNIFEAISEFQTYRRDKSERPEFKESSWFKPIFNFESHRYECQQGSYVLTRMPANLDSAYRDPEYRSNQKPSDDVDWILVHRANGQKQASIIGRSDSNTLSKLSNFLTKEIEQGWERRGIA